MRRYDTVTGCAVPVSDSSKYPSAFTFRLLNFGPEDEGTRIFRNVGNYTPKDKVSHPRTNESSVTPLRQPEISQVCLYLDPPTNKPNLRQ